MDTSSFSEVHHRFPDSERLPVNSSTCDCYRVRLYGKLHFQKRLKAEFRTNPRYVAALHKEFETGYNLDHPHLVRYMSCGDDYLLTEFVDGETLKDFSASHPDYFKSREHTDRFLSQLLGVLAYLHTHQVVHLDLKPDNILITRIGYDVKLTDLGYCYTDIHPDTMGRTGKYAAPEQLQGYPVDARTDVYAVGKILQMLSVPPIYNKVVAHCTCPSPSDRYQSVEELREALKPSKSYLKYAFVLTLLLMGIASLFYRVSPISETLDVKYEKDTIVIIQQEKVSASPAPSNTLVDHKSETKTSPPPSSALVEHKSEIKPSISELSDEQKKEIRKITLDIVQPIYQRRVEPFVSRVTRGDFDDKFPNIIPIIDSLNIVCVEANQEVFAALRKKDLRSQYPEVPGEDVNTEFLNAIGDVGYYYSQKVRNHFYHQLKLPPNPFDN